MRSSWRWQILAATGQRKQTSLRDVTVQLKLARVVQHIGRMLTRQDKTRQGKSYYVYCEILAIAEINAWDPCIRWISRRLENLHSNHVSPWVFNKLWFIRFFSTWVYTVSFWSPLMGAIWEYQYQTRLAAGGMSDAAHSRLETYILSRLVHVTGC